MPDHPAHTFADFLIGVPPNKSADITDSYTAHNPHLGGLKSPVIKLYCDSEHCGGERSHDPDLKDVTASSSGGTYFISYFCRHCGTRNKGFALSIWKKTGVPAASMIKIGEHPHYGPHTPAKVLRIFGDAKEFYLKGRRAESLGLGIAAFAYYRRVVEDHKNALLEEILRVSKHLEAAPDQITKIEAGLNEISFEKSLEAVKGAIPESLLLRGKNPMGLLHTALSAGLHNDNDEECLELASAIRVVLADFAERVQTVMAENQELKDAVTKLIQRQQSKKVLVQVKEAAPAIVAPASGQSAKKTQTEVTTPTEHGLR